MTNTLSHNFTYDKIIANVKGGKKLTTAETAFLEGEARATAEGVIGRHQSKGTDFLLHLSKAIKEHADAEEQRRNPKPQYVDPLASLFGEGSND